MFTQDDETDSSEPEMTNDATCSKNGTRQVAPQDWLTKKAPETFMQAELQSTTDRPFYTRPSFPNRRARPHQKWFVVAGFLMAAALGYRLGLNHRPPSSPPDLHGLPSAGHSSSPSKTSETEIVALKGGNFSMGDPMDGLKDAQLHQVSLSPFLMAKYEVTLELWEGVMLWGRDHGYPDLPSGSGKAYNHPVYDISWIDAVKWCNALSEKEGLTPCYYAEATWQTVLREGMSDIENRQVNWSANGYRLPTEAEWEFAARGGPAGKRFPWGDEITHELANYHGSPLIEYDKSQHEGTATDLMSSPPYTAAIGRFQPNGFGLHDMTGNVAEWCWDFYDPSYETQLPLLNNPHGPDRGTNCVARGGSWRHTAADARCANRFSLPGDLPATYVGFRVARGH